MSMFELHSHTHVKVLSRFGLIASLAAALLVSGCAALCEYCRLQEPPGEAVVPSIAVPQPRQRKPASVDPTQLPEGARAVFPAYDGDNFFVSLPVEQRTEVSAKEVLDTVVVPILKAIGFQRGAEALRMPPSSGVKMPVADLKGLATAVDDEYRNNRALMRPKTQKMLDVLAGRAEPDEEINMALKMGEGMNFAQYVAGIERQEIQYPFSQIHNDVPIEHTMLIASRWQGQSVTSVWGTLYNDYVIVNQVKLKPSVAVTTATKALNKILDRHRRAAILRWPVWLVAAEEEKRWSVWHVEAEEKMLKHVSAAADDGPHLLLLPYGSNAAGAVRLRYTYRMIIRGQYLDMQARFLLWLDAQYGAILKLVPLIANVGARGRVWNRDPGVDTTIGFFQVDPASGGVYTLQRSGIFNRVDCQGDGCDDVSISDSTNGSSATFANFDQAPINIDAEAWCASGTNRDFQQVHLYSVLSRDYQTALSLGIFTPFPEEPWTVTVEDPDVYGSGSYATSEFELKFGVSEGYNNSACPAYVSSGSDSRESWMNSAHDSTLISHELGHNLTWRFTITRPTNWCGSSDCEIPVEWVPLEDLADFWADHFNSTNCTGGWVAKNVGGVNSDYCSNSHEGPYLPRLHDVTVDHFPEHRSIEPRGPYEASQIAAAALWQVRLGMRSKCRPSGTPQFAVRFARALKRTAFFGITPAAYDTGIYRYLHDLEIFLIDEWAISGSDNGAPAFRHNGPHSTNKVTAGFARAGLFLIPYQCLDGVPGNNDPIFCPSENGGDAVIDINDNEVNDDIDPRFNGVEHPEVDFLRFNGPAPTFHVWTGPRYRLNGTDGNYTLNNPSPCNIKFRVEVSTDPAFPAAATINSPWTNVDTNPMTPDTPECYGTWTPNATQWNTLQSGGVLTRIYYRAKTHDALDGNERVSTEPGNGLWIVPPPYALITADGQSDY